MAEANNNLMEKIISLCKRRGFVYPASEIYGGFANAFDYGPLGSQLKKNIKDFWWKKFVIGRDDIVGLDSAIIQHPKVWEASGHLKSFSDPLVECKKCHKRFREDHVEEAKEAKERTAQQKEMLYCKRDEEHEFAEAKNFNLMFKTHVGPVEDPSFSFKDGKAIIEDSSRYEVKASDDRAEEINSSPNINSSSVAYLRPETAQGIFIDFQNVTQSTRVKLPFGIAQIGKAFRNEITPGNFIFRTREFEQAEIEYFIRPDKEESEKVYKSWINEVKNFYLECGVKEENLSIREHAKEELSFYSTGTSDIEYRFPFGVSELAGIAQRTDYDLKAHGLEYFDEESGKKFVPFVVEPSQGVDRAALAILCDAYDESDGSDGRAAGEITMRLSPKIAPIKVGVFPLVKKEGLPEIAKKIATDLRKAGIATFYDESGSVGRRYRRQDEIGTPWCITVDFDSLKDRTVTLRDRDTMKQERIKIEGIIKNISDKINA